MLPAQLEQRPGEGQAPCFPSTPQACTGPLGPETEASPAGGSSTQACAGLGSIPGPEQRKMPSGVRAPTFHSEMPDMGSCSPRALGARGVSGAEGAHRQTRLSLCDASGWAQKSKGDLTGHVGQHRRRQSGLEAAGRAGRGPATAHSQSRPIRQQTPLLPYSGDAKAGLVDRLAEPRTRQERPAASQKLEEGERERADTKNTPDAKSWKDPQKSSHPPSCVHS